jgi:hypothetical protein
MRLADSHNTPPRAVIVRRAPFWVNGEIPVAELPENGIRTQVPTSPCEWRIAIHVLGIDDCTRIQQELDGFFSAECGRAVKGRLGLRSAVAHESPGFNVGPRRAIRVRAVQEQDLNDEVEGWAIRFAQRRVQGRLSGVF